jgi:hypothetical protein
MRYFMGTKRNDECTLPRLKLFKLGSLSRIGKLFNSLKYAQLFLVICTEVKRNDVGYKIPIQISLFAKGIYFRDTSSIYIIENCTLLL